MAFTLGSSGTHTTSTGNPITASFTLNPGVAGIILPLNVQSGTSRAGAAPSLGSATFVQANSTQKAATTPEVSAEVWYLDRNTLPQPGTYTLTIPNTGGLSIAYRIIEVRGGKAVFDQANGANATATNPSPGAITPTEDGAFCFALVATGAQTWAPSAQVGTIIQNSDDGAIGTGTQYTIQSLRAAITLSWTFGTSDDYGSVVMCFKEIPANILNNYARPKISAGNNMSVGGIG